MCFYSCFYPWWVLGTPVQSAGPISFVSSYNLCFLYSNLKFMRAGTFLSCLYNKGEGGRFCWPARTEVSSHQYLLRFSVCTCSVQERQGGKKTRKSSLALFHIFHFKCKEWGVSSLSRLIVVQGTAEIEDLHTSVEMHNHLVLCGRAGRCKLHLFASGCVTH